jgi:hypothetical protein
MPRPGSFPIAGTTKPLSFAADREHVLPDILELRQNRRAVWRFGRNVVYEDMAIAENMPFTGQFGWICLVWAGLFASE